MDKTIPTVYNPQEVEQQLYQTWVEKGYFHAEPDMDKHSFSIVIPPPNVTGQLHMGHALDETLQDILIRFQRMQGRSALWMPGTDHAGIATQIKVEEQLAKEGLSRYDLGREQFIDRVWEWKRQYGDRILNQLKSLGSSCDWERERFTMDEGCSEAVREVFVRLYEKGLIYRGNRIINWCPRCRTALSDVEVEHVDSEGHFWHISYPLENSDQVLIIATTRPETMLGDVAVAVHPQDSRYQDIIGKQLILPIVGRKIPIIADDYVDPAFGTGAVKVTPAHDPNDFEMGQRHSLPQINVLNPDGTMTAECGRYAGMDRYECRKQLIQDLQEQGFLVKEEPHNHAVGHCQRCHTVVEPMVSKQWFVDMKPLAEPAMQVVKDGKIVFVPERFTRTYLNWLENIRDWCISRQLWWGHRIPAWYCECGETIVARTQPQVCPKCGGTHLKQDPDVLDTWFSSALWPFSTMGWPHQTKELSYYYPTAVLVTGYDIIFFWVARMIFMAMEFMQEIPFKHVFIHGLVRDSQGRKMSKSLGNGIDPVEVIQKYGADTLRFTLITGNTPGNDMRFYWERVESSRNFANKIWNAARFVQMNLEGFEPGAMETVDTLPDRWIISRYNQVCREVTNNLEHFELGEAARSLYEFIWNEFCDWYIEIAKPRLYNREDRQSHYTAQHTLWFVLSNTMKLLHPFMPFITETIWQALPHQGESIVISPWPEADDSCTDQQALNTMNLIMDVVRAIRNMRAEADVNPGKKAQVIILLSDQTLQQTLEENRRIIEVLGSAVPLEIMPAGSEKPAQAAAAVVTGAEVYMPLRGLIDIDKELAKMNKELAGLDKEIARVNGKLNNAGFLSKAPADVIEKEQIKAKDFIEKRQTVLERIEFLQQLK